MLICSRNNKKNNLWAGDFYRTHCMVCNLSSIQFQPLNLFHFCNWTIYHCPLELCLWWWWKIVILFQFPMPPEIIINTTTGLWVGWHWEVRRGWLPCSQFAHIQSHPWVSWVIQKTFNLCSAGGNIFAGMKLCTWGVCVWIASKICLDTHSQLSAKFIVPTLPRAMGCKRISLGEAVYLWAVVLIPHWVQNQPNDQPRVPQIHSCTWFIWNQTA